MSITTTPRPSPPPAPPGASTPPVTAPPPRAPGGTRLALAAATTRRAAGRQLRLTPGILTAMLIGLLLLTLLALLAGRLALSGVRGGAQYIGQEAEPGAATGEHLGATLEDMHANAADQLLVGPREVDPARDAVAADQAAVALDLTTASGNISFPGEQEQVLATQQAYAQYLQALQGAVDNNRLGYPVGLAYFRQADDLMRNILQPAVQKLVAINESAQQAAYNQRVTYATVERTLVAISLAALLVGLIAAQVYLFRRTRRTFNAPLLGATLLAGMLLLRLWLVLGADAEHLRVAQVDAYRSVKALTVARTTGFAARTDESLWLLSNDDSAYADRFTTETMQLANPLPTAQSVTAARTAVQRGQPVGFSGTLADELNHASLPGESAAALEAFNQFAQYLADDAEIRQAETAGNHAQAIQLEVGTGSHTDAQGQQHEDSNKAFGQYDAALGQALAISQGTFDSSIGAILEDVNGADLLLPILLLLIAGLTIVGIQPRIAEYS